MFMDLFEFGVLIYPVTFLGEHGWIYGAIMFHNCKYKMLRIQKSALNLLNIYKAFVSVGR